MLGYHVEHQTNNVIVVVQQVSQILTHYLIQNNIDGFLNSRRLQSQTLFEHFYDYLPGGEVKTEVVLDDD